MAASANGVGRGAVNRGLSSVVLLICAFLGVVGLSHAAAPAGEAERLGGIRDRLESAGKATTELRQQLALRNAADEIAAAAKALAEGDEKAAIGHKRKAMQWATWAAEACADPGELAVQIGESLIAEGAMTPQDLGKVKDLFDVLDAAKKRRGKSGNPFYDGMAIAEIVNAIIRLIGEGFDGWHPKRAINWYADAAASCEDVQALIDRLLGYEQKNEDATGIPAMGTAAAAEIRRLLDELHAMKRRGATPGELAEMADRIKAVMRQEGQRVARARHDADASGSGTPPREEPGARAARGASSEAAPSAAVPVTTVNFSALDGDTEVNRRFVGRIETIAFVAADGREIDRGAVSPDVTQRYDAYRVRVGKPQSVAAIVLTGTAGIVRLLAGADARGGSTVAGGAAIAPIDGVLEVRNGAVDDTLAATASGEPLRFERPIGDLSVTIDGRAVDVVATRPGQVAVVGRGIAAGGADRQVSIASAGQVLATARVPTWGYEIALPKVTRIGVWIPVTLQLFGLGPAERVSLRFQPLPGQEIEPLATEVGAGQALAPMPVARLRTTLPGAQALNVLVTREAAK